MNNILPFLQTFSLIKTAVSAEDLKVSEASRRLKCSTVSESWGRSRPQVKNRSTRTSAIRTPSVNSWVTRSLTFDNHFWSSYIFCIWLTDLYSCELRSKPISAAGCQGFWRVWKQIWTRTTAWHWRPRPTFSSSSRCCARATCTAR